MLDLAEFAVTLYLSDPDLHRPLIREISSTVSESHGDLTASATGLWQGVLEPVAEAGSLAPDCDVITTGRVLQTLFLGALRSWAFGGIDGRALRHQVNYGVAVVLLGVLQGEARQEVTDFLETIAADRSG